MSSWKLRNGKDGIPAGRLAPDYGDGSGNFTIVLHHHGKFNKERTRYYGGAKAYFDFCHVDEMSMLELKSMASLCGLYGDELNFYCSKSGINNCQNILKMVKDIDAHNLSIYLDSSGCVGVFITVQGNSQDSQPSQEVEDENDGEGDQYHVDEEYPVSVEDYERITNDENQDGIEERNHDMQSQSSELNELFQSILDDKILEVDADEQSIGSDSINEMYVDSDCDLSNEDPEFYKNVHVESNLGGLYASMPNLEVQILTPPTRSSTTAPRMYDGFIVFNPKTDMEDPRFEHGMLFEGPEVFRAAAKQHSVKHGKQLTYKKNERTRIGLKCAALGCPWQIYVASYKGDGPHTLQVKTLIDEHRCARVNKLTAADSNWMADHYDDFIMTTPNWDVKAMKAIAWRKHNLSMSKYQMYRARRKVQSRTNGTVDEQYAEIPCYGGEIQRSDPYNTVKITPLKREDGKELFQRIYICWGAMKRGFEEGLRKFIFLDGCHLKTKNGGILLTAIGLDPNNGMYPIAYAIVEKEKTDTWQWFMEYLRADLKIENDGSDWCFMSDKQKGLIKAVDNVCGKAEHRFCVIHMYKNFKVSHSGLSLQELVWKVAKSARVHDFENALSEIGEKDNKAKAWLEARPAAQWSRSFFSTQVKTDICVNNLSERFNGLIKESRAKPIIEFLEDLRILFMKRVWVSHQQMSKWWGKFCPKAAEKLEMASFKSNNFQCIFNGEEEFEVTYITGGKDQWQVNITERTCSCRKWQLTGIPCSHVICCVKFLGRNEEDYMDPCYNKSLYMKVYSHCMHVLKGRLEWPQCNRKLLPPLPEKMPGRPKKYHRKRTAQEIQDRKARLTIEKAKETGHLGKHGIIMICRYCDTQGHNRRGCLKRKADDDAKAAQDLVKANDTAAGIKRSKNVVANTTQAIQETMKQKASQGKLPIRRPIAQEKTNKSGVSGLSPTKKIAENAKAQVTPKPN